MRVLAVWAIIGLPILYWHVLRVATGDAIVAAIPVVVLGGGLLALLWVSKRDAEKLDEDPLDDDESVL